MTDDLDDYDRQLLAAAGLRPTKSCVDCRRGWRGEDGRVHCGSSPDVDPPPPWASRKYSAIGILKMASGDTQGMDCENVDPDDAEECGQYVEEG